MRDPRAQRALELALLLWVILTLGVLCVALSGKGVIE